jgi:hypothetical protein
MSGEPRLDVDGSPEPGGNGGTARPMMIVEPRCKVCGSEHRLQIDEMLRSGRAQREVLGHWNGVLGVEYFTPNNLSVHARKHLYGNDLDEYVRKLARTRKLVEAPTAFESLVTPEAALRTVLQAGLDLVAAGATVPEPGDVIRAAKELDRMQREGQSTTEAEMMHETRAFMAAVKSNVPEEQWEEIYADYQRNLLKGSGASTRASK